MKVVNMWAHEEAVALATLVEMVCVKAGCHVALTGGLLYKSGARKDCDFLFYRIRQIEKIDMDLLWKELATVGVMKTGGFGWCYKAQFTGKQIDCFFPEEQGGEYKEGGAA
jgi:hypothetical protein